MPWSLDRYVSCSVYELTHTVLLLCQSVLLHCSPLTLQAFPDGATGTSLDPSPTSIHEVLSHALPCMSVATLSSSQRRCVFCCAHPRSTCIPCPCYREDDLLVMARLVLTSPGPSPSSKPSLTSIVHPGVVPVPDMVTDVRSECRRCSCIYGWAVELV
jgi:hypothetical protein